MTSNPTGLRKPRLGSVSLPEESLTAPSQSSTRPYLRPYHTAGSPDSLRERPTSSRTPSLRATRDRSPDLYLDLFSGYPAAKEAQARAQEARSRQSTEPLANRQEPGYESSNDGRRQASPIMVPLRPRNPVPNRRPSDTSSEESPRSFDMLPPRPVPTQTPTHEEMRSRRHSVVAPPIISRSHTPVSAGYRPSPTSSRSRTNSFSSTTPSPTSLKPGRHPEKPFPPSYPPAIPWLPLPQPVNLDPLIKFPGLTLYPIKYNIWLQVEHGTRGSNVLDRTGSRYLSRNTLSSPIADGPVYHMILRCSAGPAGEIEIKIKRPSGILIRDVLQAVHDKFAEKLTPSEAQAVTPEMRATWERRCKAVPRSMEERAGLRRVDLLNGTTSFCGLTNISVGVFTLFLGPPWRPI